ncbi:MAG: Na+/H+ antiporter NhaC family protein, partial [Sporomusa sp.]
MLLNPVLISVLIMSVLCLFKVNIIIAIMISALVAGLMAGIPLPDIMPLLIKGMGGNAETALSYILLGALAYAIQKTGLATMASTSLEKVFGKNGKIFLLILAGVTCFSQNLIPVHIAFIPILIPPLLKMMDDLKLDRRGAACALTFGLKAPYIAIPAGFGLIFQGIIVDEMARNGVVYAKMDVWKAMAFPALGMVAGLLVAIFFSYRKPREYHQSNITANFAQTAATNEDTRFTIRHFGALLGAVAAFAIQIAFGSLPLGALVALLIMLAFKSIRFEDFDTTVLNGIYMMGFIAFVMMVAAGYGNVLRETGGVPQLVEASAGILGNSKLLASIVMLVLGLIITLGIGTSFGTIPIIATIYVPLCATMGFSPMATVLLIGVAAALGDAGSPASDST